MRCCPEQVRHSPAVAPHRARVSTPPRVGLYGRLVTANLWSAPPSVLLCLAWRTVVIRTGDLRSTRNPGHHVSLGYRGARSHTDVSAVASLLRGCSGRQAAWAVSLTGSRTVRSPKSATRSSRPPSASTYRAMTSKDVTSPCSICEIRAMLTLAWRRGLSARVLSGSGRRRR